MITQLQEVMTDYAELLERLRDVAELSACLGQKLNALSALTEDEPTIPRASTVSFGFVDRNDGEGLRIRATVEFGVHPTTAAGAEDDWRALFPFAEGVHVEYAGTAAGAEEASDAVLSVADVAPSDDSLAPLHIGRHTTDTDNKCLRETADRASRKHRPLTCVEWANDDAAWDSYVRQIISRGGPDHPLNKYVAVNGESSLPKLRKSFLASLHVVADLVKYTRPGARFTKWLEAGVT